MNGKTPTGRSAVKLWLVALVFLAPFVGAFWLYFGDASLKPSARTNHGALLEPIIDLDEIASNPEWALAARDHWVLLYENQGRCDRDCEDALYTLRQARLMLGQDMNRLRRVFLHGEIPPDTVFIEERHRGLITLEDRPLTRRLAEIRPAELAPGGFFLVDPLGNLVMYFPPDIVPGNMVDDIEHLLKLSRIG